MPARIEEPSSMTNDDPARRAPEGAPPVYPPAPPVYAPQPAYSTAPPPGYPGYAPGYQGYGYAPPMYPVLMPPPRPKRDTYRLVISIISIVGISLTLVAGLILLLIVALTAAFGLGNSLTLLGLLGYAGVMAVAGGGVGLYLTIRALMGRPSAWLRLPPFWAPLGLEVVVLGAGVAQHMLGLPQAPAPMEVLLVWLSGILPALGFFTLAAERLNFPSTWRRVWMSFLSGSFLAVLIAIILELVAQVALTIILQAGTGSLTNVDPNNGSQILLVFLIVSVVAPVVEEGFKPTGPLTMMGRIGTPSEAFLLGMAAGMGFAILETMEYITTGSADWIVIALIRLGAGLLHGTGAGMATMGWWYLTRGRGVPNRVLKGLGAIFYAMLQHGLFNGSTLLEIVPGPIGQALQQPLWFFGYTESTALLVPFAIYVGIFVVLLAVTRTLRRRDTPTTAAEPAPEPATSVMLAGGVR
jgi:RsiW-degrading membrane proteinase PrsW (M82 family)